MRSIFVLAATALCAAALPAPDTQASASLTSRQSSTLPSSFQWSSSGVLIGPKSDDRGIDGIKDPSIIYVDGTYHVFASTAQSAGYNLVYLNFTDFAEANTATFNYLDQAPLGTGYRAAPQVFFFEPQQLWYLVYQNGNAAYSTNPDISEPKGWTAPRTFYSAQPKIIADNIGDGYWVDMWVICDATTCHLFSSDDNGHLYRSQTSLDKFPLGFDDDETVMALSDANRYNVFEAANVYRIGDGGGYYLLLVEAIGANGARYFRSWTSGSLAGTWEALAASESEPFAGAANVDFGAGSSWTTSISHGEVVRDQVDQTLTISPCNLRYLYQGLDPEASGEYNALPWRLGLLTQTNSAC